VRPLIIATLLCTWSACSCGSTPCSTIGGGGSGGSGGSDTQLGYVGKPVTVEIQVVENFSGCGDPTQPQVTSAVVEVLDPSNQKVAATVTPPVEAAGEVSCTVTFTPASPGPYHVAVRLAPNGGTVQRDVMAAVDRRALSPSTFALPPDQPLCDQIDFDGQTLLCHDANMQQVRSLRLDAGVGSDVSPPVAGEAFALSEGKVWVFSLPYTMTVYGLGSDGALAYESDALIVSQGVRTKVLANGDEAFFIDDDGFQELTALPDGGISSSGVTPLTHATGGQWLPDVGATVFSDFQNVCSWALTPGVAADPDAGTCIALTPASVIGYDDDGVWWIDKDPKTGLTNPTLFVTGWHAGMDHATAGTLTIFGAQPPASPPSGASQQQSVLLTVINPTGTTVDTLVPRFDGTLAWVEHYPTIDTVGTVFADSRYIWFIENNTLTYYRR
jgi:hypothetical protein